MTDAIDTLRDMLYHDTMIYTVSRPVLPLHLEGEKIMIRIHELRYRLDTIDARLEYLGNGFEFTGEYSEEALKKEREHLNRELRALEAKTPEAPENQPSWEDLKIS